MLKWTIWSFNKVSSDLAKMQGVLAFLLNYRYVFYHYTYQFMKCSGKFRTLIVFTLYTHFQKKHNFNLSFFPGAWATDPDIGSLWIMPDSLVYTLLQKKDNLQNVAFLLEESVHWPWPNSRKSNQERGYS